MAFENTLNRHHNCKVVILPRYHKNKPHLIPGLYCETHGKLIKWLKLEDADELIKLGVEEIAPFKDDVIKLRDQVKILPRGNWI